MINDRDKEIGFMLEIEKWLVQNDINDEISSFEQLKSQNLCSYLDEVKNWLEYKAKDLVPELNEMINDFKNQQEKSKKSQIYNSQSKDEEEIEK